MMRSSIISKFRREKVSILTAAGSFNKSDNSCAASSSGLMDMDSPSCCRTKLRLLSLYSGLRMRAMVCFAPIFLARKQLSIFSSSDLVDATNSSACSTCASSNVS